MLDIRHKWTTTLINAAAIVVIVAGLRAAASIVTQLLLVAFLVIVLSPIYYWLVRRKCPTWLALVLVICTLVVSVVMGIALLVESFSQLARKLPDYYAIARDAIGQLSLWLEQFGIEIPRTLLTDYVSGQNARALSLKILSVAQGLTMNGIVIILLTAFGLCELPALAKFRKSRWMTEELWIRCVHVAADVKHYMGIKTMISLVTGILIYIGLVLMKIDSPLLLAIIVFLLNYVPVIGSIIATIPGVLLALLAFGPGKAAAVAAFYLILNQLLGNILEPQLMGRGFGVSPVVILVSMLFWGFVLGPVGMMLSVPLTMGVRIVLTSLRDLEKE